MRAYFPSDGVLAATLPLVSRSAGLVWPPEVDVLDGAALNGVPLTGPAASATPARSAGAVAAGATFGTGAGVQTCWARAGVGADTKTDARAGAAISMRASARRMGQLRFGMNWEGRG